MAELDKRALDAWIERIPEWESELVTQNHPSRCDLQDAVCEWCSESIGYHTDATDAKVWRSDYWQLDEDAEHCVCDKCYTEHLDDLHRIESEIDQFGREIARTHASDDDYSHYGEESSIIRRAEDSY